MLEVSKPRYLRKAHSVSKRRLDTTNEDPQYWEEVLRSEGLSMNRGLRPSHGGPGRRHKGGRGRRNGHLSNDNLQYVGAGGDLDAVMQSDKTAGPAYERAFQNPRLEDLD